MTAASRKKCAVSIDFGRDANAVVLGRPCVRPPVVLDAQVGTTGTIASAKDAGEAMQRLFHRLPPCGIYLLEEQSKVNSNTPLLESAFSALASTIPGALVIHVPVSRVANHFDLPKGSHAQKKRAADAVAQRYLRGSDKTVIIAERVCARVAGLARTHDFADALLQFVWFAQVGCEEFSEVPRGLRTGQIVRATDPKYWRADERREEKKAEQKRRATARLIARPPPAKRRRKL